MEEWRIEVHHINVNAGDSELIFFYQNDNSNEDKKNQTPVKALLIDAGDKNYGKNKVLPYLENNMPKDSTGTYKTLDAIIVTHYDADHVGGIQILLNGNTSNATERFITNFIGNPTLIYDQGWELNSSGGRKCPYNTITLENLTKDYSLAGTKSIKRLTAGPNGGDKILGFDLLWGTEDKLNAYAAPSLPSNISVLREKNGLDNTLPALFCVAVNEKTLPTKTPLDVSPLIFPMKSPTIPNANSIAVVLVAPNNDVIHYLGGDLYEQYEKNIAGWLIEQDYNYKNIPAMKLSHHGADTSTPTNLLKALSPQYVIASAGSKHRHPNLDLIIYVELFNKYLTKTNSDRKPTEFLATNYPYYMVADKINELTRRISSSYFNEVKALIEDDPDFQNKSGDEALDNVIDKWINAFDDYKDTQKFLDLVEKEWKSIGSPKCGSSIISQKVTFCINNGELSHCSIDPIQEATPMDVDESPKKHKIETSVSSQKKKAKLSKILPQEAINNIASDSAVIYSSTFPQPPTSPTSYILTAGCDFDNFVQLLDDLEIIISNPNPVTAGNQLSGDLGGKLGLWFNEIGVNTSKITINLNGNISNNMLTLKAADVNITLTINLNTSSPPSSVVLTGTLQPEDNTFLFELSSQENVSTKIQDNIAFLCGTNDTFFGPLFSLFNIIDDKGFTLTTTSTDDEESSYTNLIYNPVNSMSVWYLVNNLGDRTILNNFTIKNMCLGLSSCTNILTDNYLSQGFSCYFWADMQFGTNPIFKINTKALLNADGTGSLAFDIDNTLQSQPTSIITSLASLLSSDITKDISTFSSNLKNMGIELNIINSVILSFDLRQKHLTSFEIISDFTFNHFTLEIHLSFPYFTVWGSLQEANGETFSNLLTNTGSDISSLPNTLLNFKLKNLEFFAQPADHTYSFNVDLAGADDGTDVWWMIPDKIGLENISVDLSTTAGNISVELSVTFSLGSSKLSALGELDIGASKFIVDAGNKTSADSKLIAKLDLDPQNPPTLTGILQALDSNITLPFDTALNSVTFIYYFTEKVINFCVDFTLGQATCNAQLFVFYYTPAVAPSMSKLGALFTFTMDFSRNGLSVNFPLIGNIPIPLQTIFLGLATCNSSDFSDNSVLTKLQNLDNFPQELKTGFQTFCASIQVTPTSQPLTYGIPSQQQQQPSGGSRALVSLNDVPSTSSSPGEWITLEKTIGPLTIQRVGIDYALENSADPNSGKLWVMLDGTFTLGGFAAEADGLALGFDLKQLQLPSAKLNGLNMIYSSPELTIGGGFQLVNLPSSAPTLLGPLGKYTETTEYSGGFIVNTPALSLTAIGAYSQWTLNTHQKSLKPLSSADDNSDFFSVYLFANADAKIESPPITVNGITAGFGYNSRLTLPAPNEVYNFPLVVGANNPAALNQDSKNSPTQNMFSALSVLQNNASASGNKWLTTDLGEYWFAIGVDFVLFDLVYSKALLVAEFGQDLQFTLIGRSWITLPPPPDTAEAFAYIELDIEAVLKPSIGFFGLTALLSPNTYILDPACHLTGGFAFYSWFKDAPTQPGPLSGDVVLTLGGYHPAFQSPSWYPTVPRLGLAWNIPDANIQIHGQAYFALVPSCVMGGGSLQVVYQSGALRAWLNAWADFLIHWKPFYYNVDIGVDVGISYRLNLFFFSKTIKLELGASLNLSGPPTYGVAKIHCWVITLTVKFGTPPKTLSPSLGWDDFKGLISSNNSNSSSNEDFQLFQVIIDSGLANKSVDNTPIPANWIVRPHGFSFHTEVKIPLINAKVNGTPVCDENKNSVSPYSQIYDNQNHTGFPIKPMQVFVSQSEHTITITPNGGNDTLDISSWDINIGKRNLPKALWDKWPLTPDQKKIYTFSYSADDEQQNLLQAEQTLPNHWCGVSITPTPKLAPTLGPVMISILQKDNPLTKEISLVNPITSTVIAVSDTVTQIKKISSSNVSDSRQSMLSQLNQLGFFAKSNYSPKMTNMGNTANTLFTQSPLISS